ncbi:MAG: type II toxin-antitoxin system HigB family toxin [Microvirga sp.]
MHIITRRPISAPQARWPRAASALDDWYRRTRHASWKNFAEIKDTFPAVDTVAGRYIFDIGGNKIRLIANVRFQGRRVYVLAIFDHNEYEKFKWKQTH